MSSEKSIIIYFSRADENYFGGSLKYIEKGNTEIVAEYIQDLTGADMFKVEPLVPYSKDYMECIEEAKIRTNNHDAPIKEEVPDISSYDVIYVGAPVYWGGMPEELITALDGLDYTGKTIRPFTTHEGSGLSGVPGQLKKICKGAEVLDGLAISGSHVNDSKSKVESWI
ncbi:flavodoxin [Methanobrevibacter sp.]|jgi:flavodoxin|uniref:flavodoxin n=1 Tax=Methanobrevibacter sp. TaxID=66852 RepID=UPI002E77DAD5|nr:flavodoxin [Methanobrevibacter sp.]MEE1336989.1 flavodoxin [Methanobrevibacter sp.]